MAVSGPPRAHNEAQSKDVAGVTAQTGARGRAVPHLSRYILRQLLGPVALLTLLLTCIILLTESLRLLDLVINRGQSGPTFLYLTSLVIPGLLVIILPIAFFIGTLLTLLRLNGDSELVVMASAGYSPRQLAVPVFIAAAIVMALTWSCALWLSPAGQRALADKVVDIRADVAGALLNEGEFNPAAPGLTVFIRQLDSNGQIRGILVHDSRDAKRPITYIAPKGVLAQTPAGARLMMFDAAVEQSSGSGQRLSVLSFKSYVLNLDQFAGATRQALRKKSERYLGELLNPPEARMTPQIRAAYLAEANDRLSQAALLPGLCADLHGRDPARTAAARRASDAAGDGVAGGGGLAHRGLWRGGRCLQSSRAQCPAVCDPAPGREPRSGGADGLQPQGAPGAPHAKRGRRMSWSWTLYRYLAVRFFLGVLTVYAACLALAFSIDVAGLLDRTAGHNAGTAIVVGMAVLQLPDLGQKMLPFAILLGGVFTFWRLARSQELVATRAAGVSAWDFLMPPLTVAVLIGVFAVTVFTPVSARMFAAFSDLETRYVKGQASLLAVSENGLWLRQGDGKAAIGGHALRVADQGQHLDGVVVFLYGADDHFTGRIEAASGQLEDHAWQLQDAWVSGAGGTPVHHDTYVLPTTLTPTQIQESFRSPDTMSFWELPTFIRAAQSAGFSATRYQLYLYSLYVLPALFAAMVFMAASFSLRPAREGGTAKLLMFSTACGFGVYFFMDLTQVLGRSGAVPHPAGGDRARHRLDPDRHDPPVQPGGWMTPRRPSLLLGTALLLLLPAPLQAQIKLKPPAPARHMLAAQTAKEPPQILLQADEVVYDGENQIVSAIGHVEIDDEGRILHADNVTYDQKSDQVTASGHVKHRGHQRQCPPFADHVVLTNGMRDGALNGFGALIGKNGRLAASSAQRIGGSLVIARHTVYSACKICNKPGQRTPVWQVKAERVVYDQVKHRIHFTDATLDFFGVPVLYSPVLSEPDPSVRYATGLLAPDFGNSTKIGYFARAPIYIALNDTNDITLQPMYSTKGGEMLEGEYRARWNNSGMWVQASATYNPNGGLGVGTGPQDYDHFFGAGRFALSNNWRTGFDAQLTNNSGYMRLYDISYLDRLVNDIFVENESGRSLFNLKSYYFEGLRATDVQRRIPYVLPLLNYSLIPIHNVLGGTVPPQPQRHRFGARLGAQRSAGNGGSHLAKALRPGQWTIVDFQPGRTRRFLSHRDAAGRRHASLHQIYQPGHRLCRV